MTRERRVQDLNHDGALRAFTLIELLVTTALIGVVVTAIGACLAGGMRAWDAARRFGTQEADGLVSLALLRRDAAAMLRIDGVPFEGEPDQCSIPVLVRAASDAVPALWVPGRVSFRIDTLRKTWTREEVALSVVDDPADDPLRSEVLVGSVREVAWWYASPASHDGDALTWSDTWQSTSNYPAAIRVELTMGQGDDPTVVVDTVVLPMGAER